ncbi:MAG: SGNH/GDSL hydrolase family protein, partial [Sulfurimonas sp.]|nr:SGNH/GDSL hydrolase family protein [Sulfurimonas sp.]
ERLPSFLKDISRHDVWYLGKNTSGLAVRFRSNSTSISAKWELLNNQKMNHMAETGIKGLDLYCWNNNHWQFVKVARPKNGKTNEQLIISNMSIEEREYMLFLPLYDGLVSLSIGIDSLSNITLPQLPYPDTKAPIVVYGTSITQGGCATRPGMSYTNILTRKLNKEFINLGFSGNGKLDYEIAEIMSKKHEAIMFILDFVPNVDKEQIIEKTKIFIDILRKENPHTPILLIESVIYTDASFDKKMLERLLEKNRTLFAEYKKLRENGDKKLYYLSSEGLIGSDGEATVDGTHFTDLGFIRFSEILSRKINSILR